MQIPWCTAFCLGHIRKGCNVGYGAWKSFSTHFLTEDGQLKVFHRVTELKSQHGEYTKLRI